jgi:hypothetical protein
MEAQAMQSLTDLLLTWQNLVIMVGAWFTVHLIRKFFFKSFKKPALARLLPILPVVFCEIYVWLPGLHPVTTSMVDGKAVETPMAWGATLVMGLVLGWGVGHLHKTVMQSVLGKDASIDHAAPVD